MLLIVLEIFFPFYFFIYPMQNSLLRKCSLFHNSVIQAGAKESAHNRCTLSLQIDIVYSALYALYLT